MFGPHFGTLQTPQALESAVIQALAPSWGAA